MKTLLALPGVVFSLGALSWSWTRPEGLNARGVVCSGLRDISAGAAKAPFTCKVRQASDVCQSCGIEAAYVRFIEHSVPLQCHPVSQICFWLLRLIQRVSVCTLVAADARVPGRVC